MYKISLDSANQKTVYILCITRITLAFCQWMNILHLCGVTEHYVLPTNQVTSHIHTSHTIALFCQSDNSLHLYIFVFCHITYHCCRPPCLDWLGQISTWGPHLWGRCHPCPADVTCCLTGLAAPARISPVCWWHWGPPLLSGVTCHLTVHSEHHEPSLVTPVAEEKKMKLDISICNRQ